MGKKQNNVKNREQFVNEVSKTFEVISMQKAAKILGLGIGRNTIFAILREKKLFTKGNMPIKELVDKQYFYVGKKKNKYIQCDVTQVRCPKGLIFLYDILTK